MAGSLSLCRSAYAARAVIGAHSHGAAYLCLSISGGFREGSGSGEREVVAGSAVLHRQGETHADRFGERASSCLNVSFPGAGWDLVGEWLSREGPAQYASPGEVGPLVGRLAQEFRLRDEASELALEGLAMELLAHFLRQDRRTLRGPPAWMAETLERLRCQERVSLSELARAAGVHPSTLAREFRRSQGTSPGEYRRRWRLARALEALRTSDAPLAQIAACAGFADQSHLTRALRSALGISPAAYRRQARS